MSRREPLSKHRFGVEIDGILVGRFHAVGGISAEGEVLEFQEGGRNDALLKLPGQGRLGVLRLQRGSSGEPALWRWANEGPAARKSVDVVVLNDAGAEVGRYSMRRAWPVKWQAEDFDASSAARFVESLEIAYEGITYSKGAATFDGGGSLPGGGLAAIAGRLDQARQAAQAAIAAARSVQQAQARADDAVATASGLADLANASPATVAAGGLDASWAARLGDPPEVGPPAPPQRPATPQRPAPPRPDAALPPASPAASATMTAGAGARGATSGAGVPAPFQPTAQAPAQPPAPFQPQAAAGARGFAHAGTGPQPAAAGAAPWSDGAAPVQSGAGFQQPPMRRGGFSVGA